MSTVAKKRIFWVDCIRAISFMLIIFSHVLGNESPFLQLLFGFNVPCMVIVSGYMAGKDTSKPFEYYKKRLFRIVIPSWGFFIIYFILIRVITVSKAYPYDFWQIVSTFTFMDGIGYTWILAIFLMIAIIVPILKYLDVKVKRFPQIVIVGYCIVGSIIFVLYDNKRITKIVLYIITYVFLTCIGIFWERYLKKIKVVLVFLGGVMAFLIVQTLRTGKFPLYDFHYNKYPPSIYYALYGVFIFLFLYYTSNCIKINDKNTIVKIIIYISKNSFEIYLWHIFALFITKTIEFIYARLLAVVVISIIFAYFYRNIINMMMRSFQKMRIKI